MRVISGNYKKSALYLPQNINFRPTSDFVKESIFSSIGYKIKDSLFLDLFSGSGSIGIEAISRGAKKVYFVDNNIYSIKIINKNIKILNIPQDFYKVLKKDFSEAITYFHKKNIFFDIIYADPPYEKNFSEKVAIIVNNFNILKDNGILIIEHSKREKFNLNLINLELFKILEYGDTKLTILTNK